MANTVINTPELLNLDSTTGATVLAKGTIDERPPIPTFGVDYLVVAGGGGGGGGVSSESPGAGGAGAVIYQAAGLNVIPSSEYTLYIADGGAGGGNNSQGGNGQDSYISFSGSNVVLAKGGGGGGSYSGPGLDGGSGGGGTRDGDTNSSQAGGSAVTTNIAPAGASIYGNNGASGTGTGGCSGGGGGAGEAGNTDGEGTGGDGVQINIDGNNYYWGGGGGACGSVGTGGQGGGGGGPRGGQGGTGGINPGVSTGSSADGGGNGGANTGGGGGGGTNPTGYPGGTGGSGIIILRYPNTFTLVVGSGSLTTGQLNTAVGTDEKYTSFTGGTGAISFSGTVVGGDNDATDGALRFNTETNKTEYFDGTGWYEIVDEYASGFIGPATNYFDTKLYTGNGTTQSIGGYINGSGSFNGSSSLMTITDGGIGASGTARVSFSVSLWIKTTASNQSAIINDYGTNYGFYIQMESSASGGAGKLSIANYYTGGLVYTTAGTVAINDGNWHHLVLVNNTSDSTQKLYLDGNTTPVISQALGTGTKTANSIQVGYYTGYVGTYNFDGSVDQIRFYDAALSASDAAALNLETAATATTAAFPSGQTAVATYTMDTSANGLLNTQDLSTVNYPAGAGCLALYEMNGNSNDTSGTYNGTPTNITYEGGTFDQAAVFNGSSSRIVTGVTPAAGSGQFSVSGWINVDSLSAIRGVFSTITNSGTDRKGFSVHVLTSGIVRVLVYDSAGVDIIESTDLITVGKWHHITLTYNNGLSKVYIDSNVQADTVTQLITGYHDSINIGRYYANSTSLTMLGKIDQVRIFNTALTQSQVTTLARGIATSYSGTATNVNFNGHLDFAPGLTWIKARDAAHDHLLVDSVNGAGSAKGLVSNATYYEGQYTATYGYISSLNSNGFTVAAGSGYANYTNVNNEDYVSWSWKAGGTAVTNNDGTIASQVSANKDSGFSIVKYTGNNTDGATVGTGLTEACNIVIVKDLTSANYWCVGGSTVGNGENLYLNDPGQKQTRDRVKSVQTNTFTLGSHFEVNSSNNFIAYCWHSVAGYSKMGTYTGNGNATGPIVTTGFEPSWIMIKNTTTATAWCIFDSARNPTNSRYNLLQAQDPAAELDLLTLYGLEGVDFLSTSFQLKDTNASRNALNNIYLYMAFA
jgi:hypothetical protein